LGRQKQGAFPEVGLLPFSRVIDVCRTVHRYSPSNFVQHWSTPQLLIHGSKDYRLPETESIGAFHALQQYGIAVVALLSELTVIILRLGIRSRLVIFPDENHWVRNHGNRFVRSRYYLAIALVLIILKSQMAS
jgi:dipeptidyl aminopeptidase/acylaminoacyl peptidase